MLSILGKVEETGKDVAFQSFKVDFWICWP